MATVLGYRSISRVVVALVMCAALFMFAAGPAQAICVAPGMTSSKTNVTRGETITVKAQGVGADCNDTPNSPRRGAPLAPPTGIVIEIVQDGQHTVLAKGNATSDYSFTVRLEVPSTLQPGSATLTADGFTEPVELTISDAPPAGETRGAVVRFGPTGSATAPSIAPPTQPSGAGGAIVWWIVVAVVAVGAGALVFSRKIAASKPPQDS